MESININKEWEKKIHKALKKVFKTRSFIGEAKLFSVDSWSKKRMKLKFLLEGYMMWCATFPKILVEKYQLKKKVGKIIQVYYTIDKNNHVCAIVPTFFDSKQRCEKCGRFYKLYCKHCYERSKAIRAILSRFEEEYLKGTLNVKNIKKIR